MVLDEALSSVDTENEAIIQQALDRLMTARTTLILAHRLSSVIGADRILVLKDGAVVQSGHHLEMIQQDGPYRDLMGPQVGEREGVTVPLMVDETAEPDAPASGAFVGSLSSEAGQVTWPATIRTLLRVVRPYRGQLAVTVATGIGRVIAFIGVSVLGALVLGAVRNGSPTGALIAALLIIAPLAGLLHWLESWIAHAMAYALLADMRIDLFRKLDTLAPAYLLRRRSGDLVALATQDVETVEYFFAHTIAPAIVAVLVPVSVLIAMALIAWPLALVLAPFLIYAGASPVLGRQRIDRLGSAARGALGAMGAFATETIQGLAELVMFGAAGRRRDGFMAAVASYQRLRLSLLADLSFQAVMLEALTGLGGLTVAAVGAILVTDGMIAPTMLPLLVLISVAAFLPVSEIAQVGRQLADTIASTRRLAVVQAEPVLIHDGGRDPGDTVELRFEHVGFVYPGGDRRRRCGTFRLSHRLARRWHLWGRRVPARRRWRICCCAFGIRRAVRSGLATSTCGSSSWTGCVGASRWWRRTPICSMTRWRRTSGWLGPRLPRSKLRWRCLGRLWLILSVVCRRVWLPAWVIAACSFPEVSGNA